MATVEFFPKYVQIPKTSSKERLAAVLEDLVEIVKHKKHPARPSLQLGTETNDAIRQLEEIFAAPKQDTDESPRVLDTATDKRMAPHAEPRVDTTIYPTGTIIMKKFGKGIHRGEVKRYDKDRKYYWIDYNNGDSEEMTQKQLKQFKYIDKDSDLVKRLTRSSINQANSIKKIKFPVIVPGIETRHAQK